MSAEPGVADTLPASVLLGRDVPETSELLQESGFATQGSKLKMEKAMVAETKFRSENGRGRKPLKK